MDGKINLLIFAAFTSVGSVHADWERSEVLGRVNEVEAFGDEAGNWLYRWIDCPVAEDDGEWLYTIAGAAADTAYIWGSDLGWLYTEDAISDWVYSFDMEMWMETPFVHFPSAPADYIGSSLEEALDSAEREGRPAREVYVDGEALAVTEDFAICRLNFSVLDGVVIDAATDGRLGNLSQSASVFSLSSGGIAGFIDRTIVSGDSIRQVYRQGRDFTDERMELTAEEQAELDTILAGFATLRSDFSSGPEVADGIGGSLIARGTGEGEADAASRNALSEWLQARRSVAQ